MLFACSDIVGDIGRVESLRSFFVLFETVSYLDASGDVLEGRVFFIPQCS